MLNHIPTLVTLLIFLIVISVFFSLAEAAMLSVNRYRLRHLVKHHHPLAKRVQQLLERPDRLLGVVLLCDTFADILATAIATLLALHYFGTEGVLPVTLLMTVVVLIFGEIAPKTLATIYPQQISFIAAWPLIILLKIIYPIVWFTNTLANGVLLLFGVKVQKKNVMEHLTHEELGTVLREAGGRIPADYLSMLLKVLNLEKVTVDDIMITRSEIVGIDSSEDWDVILEQLTNSQYTRMPIYQENIDHVQGMLHVRKALNLLAQEKLNKETLLEAAEEIYYVPEETPLNIQLLNFRREKRRIGLVVNEYGDIEGLVTLEDILEEIVGEFTTDVAELTSRMIHPQADGSYIVDGSINVREINTLLHANLPTDGPRTLSGLIIEYLEMIPQASVALHIDGVYLEIVQIKENVIKTVKVMAQKK
jgi:Mg2+/Co2+ transporter CorB